MPNEIPINRKLFNGILIYRDECDSVSLCGLSIIFTKAKICRRIKMSKKGGRGGGRESSLAGGRGVEHSFQSYKYTAAKL